MKKVYESPEMSIISFGQFESIATAEWDWSAAPYATNTSNWGDNETLPDEI